MARYSEQNIIDIFDVNCLQAQRKLAEIRVFCGEDPIFTGLSGWVLEKTIRYCIEKELRARKIKMEIDEQISLGGRAKADLLVGNVLVEIKVSGLYSRDSPPKLKRYRKAAEAKGRRYVFLSLHESHQPNRAGLMKVLGRDNGKIGTVPI